MMTGEKFALIKDEGDGWLNVKRVSTGEVGYIPSSYVQFDWSPLCQSLPVLLGGPCMWVLKDGDDWMVLVALDDDVGDVGGGDDDDSSQWFCSCFLVDLGQCFCLTDTIQDADADAARRINSRNFIFQMFDKTFFF